MTAPVITHIADGIGVIELARPETFNCLSTPTLRAIDEARAGFEAGREVRAILIRAQGKHFCTGADLKEVKGILQSAAELDRFVALGQQVLMRLEASPLPVVAAVQGLCLAGGLELMLAADICIAAETAQFGDQHAQFGLLPGWGGSQRLTRVLGQRRALDLFFSARWMPAAEALAAGLVNKVEADDKLLEEAEAYGAGLAGRSRIGLAEMKRLARDGLELPLDAAMRLERDTAVHHLQRPDVAEGLAAFEAKRPPAFEQ